LKYFKSLFSINFQVSILNESHHLLVKLSCKSACENLDVLCLVFAADIATVIVVTAVTPEQQSSSGAVEELRAMETCKKQKNRY